MKITYAEKKSGPKFPQVARTRFSTVEFEQVQAAAQKANMSVCAYIRLRTLGLPVKHKVKNHEIDNAINFLSQVSGLVKNLFNEGESRELVPLEITEDVVEAIRHIASTKKIPRKALADLDEIGKEVVAAHKNKELDALLVAKWRNAIKKVCMA